MMCGFIFQFGDGNMNHKNPMKRRIISARRLSGQAGLSLVETVLVMVIASLILGGLWAAYAEIRLSNQVNDTVAAVDKTVQTVRELLATKATVPFNLAEQLYAQDIMPPELSYKGTTTVLSSKLNGQCNTFTNPQLCSNPPVYTTPLGHEFFVQYMDEKGTWVSNATSRLFNVSIGFVDVSGQYNFTNQCIRLVTAFLGSASAIRDRGIISFALATGNTNNFSYPIDMTTDQFANYSTLWSAATTAQKKTYCQSDELRLVFKMR